MKSVPIEKFIADLCVVPEENFNGVVYDYLLKHPVDERTLQPYLFFSKCNYTRNLIFKNHLFELLAICWEAGQTSPIHNHHGQNCWMAVPVGKLRIQDFRIIEQDDQTGHCQLEPADSYDIHKLLPAEVDPTHPVHRVLNPPEFRQRAVSLHIYAKPFDRCLVYSLAENQCREIQLRYTGQYGEMCDLREAGYA